ncbi:MAG: ribokinase [Clostridiales bacterium]|jgi:ribokinase|nr:ribokinase [Clostridiales bacterium]
MENNTQKANITVLGSFVVDLMSRTPHLPVPGETVLGGPFKLGPGGKGSNQATAAARAGANVVMCTKLGQDEFAKIALDNFTREGINTEHVYQDSRYETGVALIMVDEDAENMIVVAIGANNYITKEEVYQLEGKIAQSQVLLTQLETNIDAVIHAVDIAKAQHVPVILNPAPIQPIPDDLLAKVDILTPNETEAEKLTNMKIKSLEDAKAAGSILLDKGVKNVVITLGKNGALIVNKQKVEHVPAVKVDPVDTTGAGDAFNGGLAVALAEGKDLAKAVEFANYLAALSVTKVGTAPSMPLRKEIDDFMHKTR